MIWWFYSLIFYQAFWLAGVFAQLKGMFEIPCQLTWIKHGMFLVIEEPLELQRKKLLLAKI